MEAPLVYTSQLLIPFASAYIKLIIVMSINTLYHARERCVCVYANGVLMTTACIHVQHATIIWYIIILRQYTSPQIIGLDPISLGFLAYIDAVCRL